MLSWLGLSGGASLGERRKLARRECYCEVVYHISTEEMPVEQTFKGVITDIGVGGMRLRCYEPIPRGAAVAVEFPEKLQGVWVEKIKTLALWSWKHKTTLDTWAGLKYNDDKWNMAHSWVKFVMEDVGFTPDLMKERRKTMRVKAATPAIMSCHDPNLDAEMEAAGVVKNMSQGGLMVEARDPFMEGRQVEVVIQSMKKVKFPGVVKAVTADPSRKFLHSITLEGLSSTQQKALTGEIQRLMKVLGPS